MEKIYNALPPELQESRTPEEIMTNTLFRYSIFTILFAAAQYLQ